MFTIRLSSVLNFIFNIFLSLVCFLIFFILFKLNFPSIVYCDSGQSLAEMDGWTKNPNLDTLKDFPYKEVLILLGFNFLFYSAIVLSWSPTYCEIGVQADSLSVLTGGATNLSDLHSIMSVSDSPINSLSTALSDVPSLVPTESLYPELAKTTDLNHLTKTQEVYQRIMGKLDPNMSNYPVIKNFLIHARGSYFNALEAGHEVGSPDFNSFFKESIKSNTMLVAYLNHNNFNISLMLNLVENLEFITSERANTIINL